jgi:2-polyprenyl-6-methoxyphenol hydroxylase-like FAD-dependent oxidoreductase
MSHSTATEKVLIVGAGVVGLSVAIGPAQSEPRIACQVLESRKRLDDGAANTTGIRVSSRGVDILKSFLNLLLVAKLLQKVPNEHIGQVGHHALTQRVVSD